MPDFTNPDPSLSVGSRHAGFTVTSVEPLPELSATAYVFRHDASGARALWIATADNNKSFAIAFKTPPADSTGTFHILEHSVLCGSDDYPVKEPFVNLLKTSMQTFLNALTFPDKTMYPVASTNVTDLENLMGVYLDAVFHPAIYRRPRIFEQEGWHLELQGEDGKPAQPGDPDAHLIYNGVVFNEMKGALSDPDEVLFEALNESLFPDTCYRFESGGNPRVIPTLTYEKFLDNHARHYNLANSYTMLYGDLDIDRELAFIDARFQKVPDRGAGAPNPLTLQAPVKAPLRSVTMATAPENAEVGLAYVIGTAGQRERVLATDVLLDALAGSNEAPLKRAVLDAGIGDDFTASLIDGELQPQVLLVLRGAKPDVAERFRDVVESTARDLVKNGIDRSKLEASLAQAEFDLREGDWGSYSDGVALSIQAMSSWLYDDDQPVAYLHYQDAIDSMKAGLDNGYFERLLSELVLENGHSAEVELIPAQDGSAAEERAELDERQAAMSADDLDAVASEVEALRQEQEAPDDPEALSHLPRLGVSDIGDAPTEPALEVRSDAPLPALYHGMDTHGIDYVYHYFDLRRCGWAELPYVGVLTDLLGKLDTKHHDASSLDTLIETKLGSLDFFCETYGKDDDPSYARPLLVVGASALSENVDGLARIPREVWSETLFENADRMHDILQQRRISLEQQFVGSGHVAAMARLSTYFSQPAAVADQMGGVGYYLFLKKLLDQWDLRVRGLIEILYNLEGRIFTGDECVISFTGSEEGYKAYWEAAGDLGLRVAGGNVVAHQLECPPLEPRDEAFVIPSDVCFCAEGAAPQAAGEGEPGTWQVASRALSYDYLWNEVRVKGGAYGVGFRRTLAGLKQFWSYRDPGTDATFDRYEAAADWLKNWNPAPEELDGYIVSTVASHDAPVKPRSAARRQDSLWLAGRPADFRDQIREQELSATADDIRALAGPLSDMPQHHARVAFGPREKLEASSTDFTIVELMGGGSD